MNQVFAGGLALIIALILWSSKKQSKASTFFKSQRNSVAKTQASLSLVIDKNIEKQTPHRLNNKKSKTFAIEPSLNSIEINKELVKLISGSPEDRLLAMQIASKWKNKKAIPFLKRGLKDSDSRVVIASAAAISYFKGKTIDIPTKSQASRPPRNVSLIR